KHHALVTRFEKAPHHVRAHAAESDHSKLHASLLCQPRMFDASLDISEMVQRGAQTIYGPGYTQAFTKNRGSGHQEISARLNDQSGGAVVASIPLVRLWSRFTGHLVGVSRL